MSEDSAGNVSLEVFAGSANEHERFVRVNTRDKRTVAAVVPTGQRTPARVGLPRPDGHDFRCQQETVDLLTTQHGVVGRPGSLQVRALGQVVVGSVKRRTGILDDEDSAARSTGDIDGLNLHLRDSGRTATADAELRVQTLETTGGAIDRNVDGDDVMGILSA